MKSKKIQSLMLGTLIAFLVLGFFPYQINAQAPVKGPNVTKVVIAHPTNGQVEAMIVQVGPKAWTHYFPDGKRIFTTYTETGRDEWSVYLNGSKFKSVTINLWKKNVEFVSDRSELRPILSSSNDPIASTTNNGNSNTQLEQQCFNAIQGKVAWNEEGNKTWTEKHLNILCKDTKDVARTIACFKKVTEKLDWSSGVQSCKADRIDATVASFNSDTNATSNTRAASRTRAAQFYGKSPVSAAELNEILSWIAERTSAYKTAYCYKYSVGRGAGEALTQCPAGLEKDGAKCYPKCKSGYTGKVTECYQNCAPGFADSLLYCQKPAGYSRVGKEFPWKIGDPVGNYEPARARCVAANSQGCEKLGLIWYPKCKSGLQTSGLDCKAACPAGQADTGTGCKKQTYTRGIGQDLTCKAGLEKSGGFCYPKCPSANYVGNGPVCWQKCSVTVLNGKKYDCGVGCTVGIDDCASVTADMVIAPISMITSLVTLGLAAAPGTAVKATGGAASVASGVEQLATLPKWVPLANSLAKAIEKGVDFVDTANSIREPLQEAIELYADQNGGTDFKYIASPDVERQIDQVFKSPEANKFIKRQWALAHLSLIAGYDVGTWKGSPNDVTSKTVVKGLYDSAQYQNASLAIGVVSIVDPTGIAGVVKAYTHPICDRPFPKLSRATY